MASNLAWLRRHLGMEQSAEAQFFVGWDMGHSDIHRKNDWKQLESAEASPAFGAALVPVDIRKAFLLNWLQLVVSMLRRQGQSKPQRTAKRRRSVGVCPSFFDFGTKPRIGEEIDIR